MSRIMAIDYGLVRIGVALSDETQTIAFGREAIRNDNKPIDKILSLAASEYVSVIVLGYPLNLKGEKTQQTLEVEKFRKELGDSVEKAGIDITIEYWDERFTSKMAADSMLQSGMKKKKRQDKSQLDIISAAILLQSYLDNKKRI